MSRISSETAPWPPRRGQSDDAVQRMVALLPLAATGTAPGVGWQMKKVGLSSPIPDALGVAKPVIR